MLAMIFLCHNTFRAGKCLDEPVVAAKTISRFFAQFERNIGVYYAEICHDGGAEMPKLWAGCPCG